MSVEFRVGDVFERLSEIPDGSIDLIVTSPPFLALRSYLPADHPDKHREIGSEATPAEFIDTMLRLTVEWGRVLAPHGSICVELGDTYAGSGGGGGDYLPGGMREGQQQFAGSGSSMRESNAAHWRAKATGRSHWPLSRSMSLIPHMYTGSLAYGRNLLTGEESPAGQWRIRNVICWARPNPLTAALGDKFRPATSYITVACRDRRWFDLDAVRTPLTAPGKVQRNGGARRAEQRDPTGKETNEWVVQNPAGAPPLDWHIDDYDPIADGDWLWRMPTQGFRGAHSATFPLELPKRLILAMCPRKVCTECGTPSERITASTPSARKVGGMSERDRQGRGRASTDRAVEMDVITIGWTDCGHDSWRAGVVLDPFAGSGTTLEAAQIVGRSGIGIDLDERNADLARQRVGMFLEVAS